MLENTGTTTTDPGGTPTDSGAAVTESAAPTIANPEFHATLPETLRTNEAFYGIDSPESLANSYAEQLQKQAELNSQLEEANAKVPTLPASAADYEVNMPEGYEAEDALFGQFKDMAFKSGMSAQQIESVLAFDQQRTANNIMQTQKQNEKVVEHFKSEWGSDYEKNLATANRAIVQFGGEEFSQALQESGLGYNKALINGFLKAGQAMSEDAMHTGSTNTHSEQRPVGVDGKPMIKFKM